jgi:hypothetical protein
MSSAISKQQVLAVLAAATQAHKDHGPGQGENEDGLAGLSIGLLLQLLFELSRSDPDRHLDPDDHQVTSSEDAIQAMRTLPLVAGYLDQQMAAGRLRRMDPVLAMQALAGPIVMHLLMQASAEAQSAAGHGVALPREGVVDELVGMWLRAMTPDHGHHQQPTSNAWEQA